MSIYALAGIVGLGWSIYAHKKNYSAVGTIVVAFMLGVGVAIVVGVIERVL